MTSPAAEPQVTCACYRILVERSSRGRAPIRGAKLAVTAPRLSNTASMADQWIPTRPGTEVAALPAMALVIATLFFGRRSVEKNFKRRLFPQRTFCETRCLVRLEGTQAEIAMGIRMSSAKRLNELIAFVRHALPRIEQRQPRREPSRGGDLNRPRGERLRDDDPNAIPIDGLPEPTWITDSVVLDAFREEGDPVFRVGGHRVLLDDGNIVLTLEQDISTADLPP